VKKHAYLITAYENRYQLEQLLTLLDFEKNDVYLQVDAKGSLRTDNLAMHASSLTILPSFPIHWGAFSMIQAELNLLQAASLKHYHYYHMITGSDLPLVSQETIHEYLEESDLEYIDFTPEDKHWAHYKAAYYHFFLENKMYLKNVFIRGLRHSCVKLQEVVGIDRSKKSKEDFFTGSTYFTITHSLVEYVLSHQAWIRNTFHHALACDEVFLQTLIMKSPFKAKLSGSDSGKTKNLRYIDWIRYQRNSPYTFRMSDYEELREASKRAFFARKFHRSVDSVVVDTIVDKIKNKMPL
jgi:Core-2/I-Branching enzyme